MKRILSQAKPSNLLALYAFLCYTANRQGTQCVYATTSFISCGLQWSTSKVKAVKARLKRLELIESVTRRNSSNRITGHYVRVRFLAQAPEVQFSSRWSNEPQILLTKENAYEGKTGFAPLNPVSSSKPISIGEVIIHALTRAGFTTTVAESWLLEKDLTHFAGELLCSAGNGDFGLALSLAFRFVHFNNRGGWRLERSWYAAFDGFATHCSNVGDGVPSEVPPDWIPHIAGLDGWPEDESACTNFPL